LAEDHRAWLCSHGYAVPTVADVVHTKVSVLDEYCAPFAGYSLYNPQRRHASRALGALVEHMRVAQETART
jgi:hypothetical protein